MTLRVCLLTQSFQLLKFLTDSFELVGDFLKRSDDHHRCRTVLHIDLLTYVRMETVEITAAAAEELR